AEHGHGDDDEDQQRAAARDHGHGLVLRFGCFTRAGPSVAGRRHPEVVIAESGNDGPNSDRLAVLISAARSGVSYGKVSPHSGGRSAVASVVMKYEGMYRSRGRSAPLAHRAPTATVQWPTRSGPVSTSMIIEPF